MKKIISLIMVALLIALTGCQQLVDYTEELKPVTFAPEVTQAESAFIDLIANLKLSSVSIVNNNVNDDNTELRRGSGVVVKKVESLIDNTYYILTTQSIVNNALNVTVYLTPQNSVQGIVMNGKVTYEDNEDIAIIRINTSYKLETVPLIALGNMKSIEFSEVFSIGTPVSNSYFNYPSEPAIVSGIQDDFIVHASPLSYGNIGSPLYLKDTGQLVGINVSVSVNTSGDRPINRINRAISINRILTLIEGLLD